MRVSGKTLTALLALLAMLVAAPLVYAGSGDDRDDGKRYKDKDARWALVDETGTIVQQTGGFSIVDCYRTNANCYISIGEDATKEGLMATIAAQNNVPGQAVSLTGEIAVGACGISQLNCAPPGTERSDVIVVTPRNSDGSMTTSTTRKRFYVEVIGPDAKTR